MIKKIIILFFIILISTSYGCSITSKPDRLPLELQAIQTKIYPYNKKIVFDSVISFLQDNEYLIKSSNFDSGIINATKSIKDNNYSWKFGTGLHRKVTNTILNIHITNFKKNKTKVRISAFKNITYINILGKTWSGDDQEIETNPEYYRKIFDGIDTNIFITNNS